MRGLRLSVAGVAAGAITASALLLAAASPAAAVDAGTSTYTFNLVPADTAVSPNGGTMASPGDYITVSGHGTFNPVARTVSGMGKFTHFNSAGAVVCRGTWEATGFTGFTDFGSNDQGQEGGVLSLVVTHYCATMGMTMTNIPMTVTSTVNAPPGHTEGITVCDFTQPDGGQVIIEPEQ